MRRCVLGSPRLERNVYQYFQSANIITANAKAEAVPRKIVGYHTDPELPTQWVAELACGHFQHLWHEPPLVNRPWVTTVEGRNDKLGRELQCKKCLLGAPPDSVAPKMNG